MLLDCHDLDAAVRSLAVASDRREQALIDAIASVDLPGGTVSEDTETAVPRRAFEMLELTDEDFRFDGTCFFHGTRTLDPSSFRRHGILPLGRTVDQLWMDLHKLISEKITLAEWRDHRAMVERGGGGHGGYLYRLKTTGLSFHGGPYAFLIRDHHLDRIDGNHDYLATPEIVHDIARTCDFDLQQVFEDAAKPYIVKFRTAETTIHALHAAFWYVHAALRGEKSGWYSLYGHDCRNTVVSVEDVLDIAPVVPPA
ncbi:hypothetical protein AB0A74_05160 [Saccharothrix sp. NPDC042600]|uniref:hypothetical protein n=1 Tax=Saccharothrix TaxID=2071 RepID=UPI0033D5D233|nr:hypothetical protein GCM10017745_36830 [Saccharothrix mutabilis subsp. capreolus]